MTRGNQRMLKQLPLCLRSVFLCGGQRHQGKMPLGEPQAQQRLLGPNTLRQWWRASAASAHSWAWRGEWKPRGAGRVKLYEVIFAQVCQLNVNSFFRFSLKLLICISFLPPFPSPSCPSFLSYPFSISGFLPICVSFFHSYFAVVRILFFFPSKNN